MYATSPIDEGDPVSEFRSGVHALDDYLRRHALRNDRTGIGRTYVLRRSEHQDPSLPPILGFYSLSMASTEPAPIAKSMATSLPRYQMPVALIGRLAVDERARRMRLGELLLMDALRRVHDAAKTLGCVGVIVDAKNANAESFYAAYDFETIDASQWPRRMFLAITRIEAAFAD